jgi:hypothetical protein
MSSISALLKDLSATLGAELVRAEAMKFFGQETSSAAPAAEDAKPKKEKKEVKPRGPSEWNLYCRKVLEEMKQQDPSATPKMAMMAAKESWAQKKAQEAEASGTVGIAEKLALLKEKKAAAKAAKAPSPLSPAGGTVSAGAATDPVELERSKVFKYLFNLQASGRANMMAAGAYLVQEFSFPDEKASEYVTEYMQNYRALKEKYN